MRSAPDALDVRQSRPERKRDPSEVSHVTNEVKATGIGQTTLAAFLRFFSLKCVRDFIRDLQYHRRLATSREQIEPLREREGLAYSRLRHLRLVAYYKYLSYGTYVRMFKLLHEHVASWYYRPYASRAALKTKQ
jgi:hypothetical protein